jgi:hypothetical protein
MERMGGGVSHVTVQSSEGRMQPGARAARLFGKSTDPSANYV